MPTIPDFDAVSQTYNVSPVVLEILPRANGVGPHIDEVRAFLAARNIIGSYAEGSVFGSSSAVVVNILVTPRHEKAFENQNSPSDQFIAISASDHRIAQGQEISAFFAGFAHTLNTSIVVDETAIIEPGQVGLTDYEDEREPVNSSSLSVIRGDLPLSAYPALVFGEGVGHYGLSQGHQIVLPAPGLVSHAGGATEHLGQLPNVVFSKHGQSRVVALQMTPNPLFELAVSVAPPLTQVGHYEPGTPAHTVSALLEDNANLSYDEDLPKKPKRDPKIASGNAVPLASFDAYNRLLEAADHLVASPPDQLFTRAAAVLDLPASIRTALWRYENERVEASREYLGEIKLTEVPALPPNTRTRFLSSLALDHSLESLASKKRSYLKRFFRTLPGTILTSVICAAIALGALTLLVFPELDETRKAGSGFSFKMLWISIGFSLMSIYLAMAASRIKFIQRLMQKAYDDGVLTKRT